MSERIRQTPVALTLLAILVATSCGCINLAANMLHAIQGNERPAEYDGLKGKRVALVCTTDGGFGADATSAMLSSYIHAALNSNVDKIDLVKQSEVDRWIDSHSQADADYIAVGKGVDAERVVALEVMNMSLRDGATLYRGRADVSVTVYDIPSDGNILYRKQMPEFEFPKLGGPTITDISEAKFRARYLTIVARTVSGLFYPVDATADFALDATANSF
jgi:hypothetical protein